MMAKKAKARRKPVPRRLSGWNFTLSDMPQRGRFEVLRIYPEVFRHAPNKTLVIYPLTGTMFAPTAWRKARR